MDCVLRKGKEFGRILTGYEMELGLEEPEA